MKTGRREIMGVFVFSVLLHVAAWAWLVLPENGAPVAESEPVMIRLDPVVEEEIVEEVVEEPEVIPEPEPEPEPEPIPEPEPDPVVEDIPEVVPPVVPEPEPVVEPVVEEPVETPEPVVQITTSAAAVEARLTYEERVMSALQRSKRYPARAERQGIEGECMLRIRLLRSGQVAGFDLVNSTGSKLLDKAAMDMVARANPFPPMPEELVGDEVEFVVPVGFALGE